MTVLTEKVIHFNRKLIMPVVLGSAIILVHLRYNYKRILLEQPSLKIELFLAIFAVICLVSFYRHLKMLLAKTPALILTQEGITDNLRMLNLKKGAKTRFIPWSDIKSIKLATPSNSTYISIQLNHTGFINKILKANVWIPSFLLDIKQDALLEMLKTYHEKSKCSKKVTRDSQSVIERF